MKLFVAKLNRDVTDDHLKELFSQYGEVEFARVITDRETGQSKCFGFVTMADPSSGRAAMEALNGQEYMRFRMVVKEAEERQGGGSPRGARQTGGARGDLRANGDNRGHSRSDDRGQASRESRHTGLQSDRANDPSEFSRLDGPPRGGARAAGKKKSDTKAKGRDIYQDGPARPVKAKRSKPKNQDWLDDLDFE